MGHFGDDGLQDFVDGKGTCYAWKTLVRIHETKNFDCTVSAVDDEEPSAS